MARRVPITTSQVQTAAKAIVGGASMADAAAAAGMGVSTIYQHKAQVMEFAAREREREHKQNRSVALDVQSDSNKGRLARLIAIKGPFRDMEALASAFPRPGESFRFDALVGSVWSLQKAGLVTFKQGRSPRKGQHGDHLGGLLDITATQALADRYGRSGLSENYPVELIGRPEVVEPTPAERVTDHDIRVPREDPVVTHPTGRDPTNQHRLPTSTVGGPVTIIKPGDTSQTVPVVVDVEPAIEEFPLLAALRARIARVERAREAARLVGEAAELLDGDAQNALLATAVGLLDEVALTDVEAEYLRFAEAVA